MSKPVTLTVNAGVATITLTQPEIRNAFSDEVIAEITAAFETVAQHAEVRAVVLAAEGPAFCAGANLNWMRRMADYSREENVVDAGKLAAMMHTIYTCPHPTIARVQGDVYAGGMGLVAACDMAVAVDSAQFCLSEVKIGLIPATIAPYVLRAMGPRAAHRYFLTGERFDTAQALRMGFVHEVVAADDLDTAVDSLLKRDDDQPTIGLLLCRDKNNIEVEFALRDLNKPMGVSEYTLVETLPDNLKGALPTVEEIEQDLQRLQDEGDGTVPEGAEP